MRIVLGNNALDGPGGTETYTLTIAEHLQRIGHEVWIHANEPGALADLGREQGLRIPERFAELPAEVDAVVAADAMTTLQLADRYRTAPVVLVGHSDLFDMALPPNLPGLLSGVVVMYDRVARRLAGMDLRVPVTRLAQPVDTEVFRPLAPIAAQAPSVLVYGNYVRGPRMAMIERACAAAGLSCTHVGGHAASAQRTFTPAQTLNGADIVIGKARVIIEAMSAGRAAYSLDHNGGDGWVTAQSYAVQASDNFGGQATDDVIDEARLIQDLRAYDAGMGLVNRDLAVRHHSAVRHAADLAALLASLSPVAPRTEPLDEMARLVRVSWGHERRAWGLMSQLERLEEQLHDARVVRHELDTALSATRMAQHERDVAQHDARTAEHQRDTAEHDHDQTRAALADAHQRLADAESTRDAAMAESHRRGKLLDDFKRTRRYRLASALGAPLDRLRGRP